MPTLDELRAWARGEAKVKGLPEHERMKPQAALEAGDTDDETVIIPSRRVDMDAMRSARAVVRGVPAGPGTGASKPAGAYRMNADNTNAILGFGTYKKSKLSDIVEHARGRSYLRWMVDNVKEDDLRNAAKHQLEAYRERKRQG